MIKRALAAAWVELLLALAIGWAVYDIASLGSTVLRASGPAPEGVTGRVLDVATALGVVLMLLALPVVALLDRQPRLVVSGLPGLRSTQPRPSVRLLRVGAGAVLLLVLTSLGLGWSILALVLIGVVDIAMVLIVLRLRKELSRRPHRRAAFTAALVGYQPRFVVYTARRNDASYQLAMWLPQLEKLGLPYLVVVRHAEAIAHAREVTTAPVICCPTGADLDAVLVPGLLAAFYVNGVSENTNFVLYRQLQHVYLGHGDSDKEMSVHPMHAMFDRIFVAGRAAVERYEESGVQIDPEKFVIVGRPQLAGLRRASDPQAIEKAAVRATSAPSRVLVAPTWRGYNAVSSLSSLPIATRVVAALLAAGAEVVFRPHPFSWLGAEQEQIEAVDALLRADRTATGRQHRLAADNRDATLSENFDDADALVTDIGSVLVDFFATEKPYAVVLPGGLDPARAPERYPSTSAAYRIGAAQFDPTPLRTNQQPSTPAANSSTDRPDWVHELLVEDPKSAERAVVRQHFLGDRPGDDKPFLNAARAMLDPVRRTNPAVSTLEPVDGPRGSEQAGGATVRPFARRTGHRPGGSFPDSESVAGRDSIVDPSDVGSVALPEAAGEARS